MYTLVDGVEFYDKDEIDTIVKSITGGTIPDEENIRTELTAKINEEATERTAADEALGVRIDEESKKRMDSDALFSKLIAGEVESRMDIDTAFANQLAAIEQLHTTLISPNGFIDSDGDAVNVNDSGKSIRQIAHEEFYRQLITDADDVKTQLDTLKELADYLQRNPSIITDMYNKLGITWSVDNPTDFGTFDFSTVLTATTVDDAVLELYNTFTNKIGDLAQLTTTFKNNIVGAVNELDADIAAEVTARTDADTALGTRIDEEVTARTDADTALGTRIDESIAARTAADEALGTRIDEEAAARTAADEALGTRIDESIAESTALDTKIGDLAQLNTTSKDTIVSAINSEFEWRRNNDEALGTRIDEEVTARTDADTALGTRIDEEAEARTNADTELDNKIVHTGQALGNYIGHLDSLKTTDKSSTVAAINELYDTVQQGGGGGTGGDTGNTVDYYVIEIEANFDGIKPNEPLRFEGDLDPDVANGITEAVAAGKALMLKIVNSNADSANPSTTIVITNYSYTNGIYTFDMNDATITGNQIIVVDYNARIRPDIGDYSGYATLSTVTVPEGGGTVVPSGSSNVYVLHLTTDGSVSPGFGADITLTPEQSAAVSSAIASVTPIIAVITDGDGKNIVLYSFNMGQTSDIGMVGLTSVAILNSGPSGDTLAVMGAILSIDTSRNYARFDMHYIDGIGGEGGGGGGGGTGGDTGDTNTYNEQFTFVIDSNEKLVEWANNDRSKGQDYTSVLVKKGEWEFSTHKVHSVTYDGTTLQVYILGIDVAAAGTKRIKGEYGSKIKFKSHMAAKQPRSEADIQTFILGLHSGFKVIDKGIFTYHTARIDDMIVENVDVDAIGEAIYSTCFFGLDNLYRCKATCTLSTIDETENKNDGEHGFFIYASGFVNCCSLFDCAGAGKVYPVESDNPDSVGPGIGIGFLCSCHVIGCKALSHCTAGVFSSAYASWSFSDTGTGDYVCADTANGGFNNTANPSA